jgi:serine/threonine-protein kinase
MSEPSASFEERLKHLLQQALAAPADERENLVRDACAGDPALLKEALDLLAALDVAGEYLDNPPSERFAPSPPKLHDAIIGPYRIEWILGRGGLATVYMATRADNL